MVSMTLSIPEDIKKKMNRFPEVNWSAIVRKMLIEKTQQLEWKENMLKQLEGEKEFTKWSVELQHAARSGRLERLKKKGLI